MNKYMEFSCVNDATDENRLSDVTVTPMTALQHSAAVHTDDASIAEAISDVRSFAAAARSRAHAKALSGSVEVPLLKRVRLAALKPPASAATLATDVIALTTKLGPLTICSSRLRASAQKLALANAQQRLIALLGREDGVLDTSALHRVSEALRQKRAADADACSSGGPGSYSSDGPLFSPYFNARVVHARRSNLRFGPGYEAPEPKQQQRAPPLPTHAAEPLPPPVEEPTRETRLEPAPPPPNMYIEVLLSHVAAAASDAMSAEAGREADAGRSACSTAHVEAASAGSHRTGPHSGLSQSESSVSSGDGWDAASYLSSSSGSDSDIDSGSWSDSGGMSSSEASSAGDSDDIAQVDGAVAEAEAATVLQSLAAAIARHEADVRASADRVGKAPANAQPASVDGIGQLHVATTSSGGRAQAVAEGTRAAPALQPLRSLSGAPTQPEIASSAAAAQAVTQAAGVPAGDGGRARARELLARVLQALPASDRQSIARMISLLRSQGRQRGQLRVLRRQAVAWDATHKRAVRNVLLGPPASRSSRRRSELDGQTGILHTGGALVDGDEGEVDEQAHARARRVAARQGSSTDPSSQLRAQSAASLARLRASRETRSERLLASGEVEGVAPLSRAERAARTRAARARHSERERQKLLLGQEQWRRRHGDGGPEGGRLDGAQARAASAGARLRRAVDAASALQSALAGRQSRGGDADGDDDDDDDESDFDLPEMAALHASAAEGRSRSHFATPSLTGADDRGRLSDPAAAVVKLSTTAFMGRAAVAWGAGARAEAFAAAARARKMLLKGIDSQRGWYASQLHTVYDVDHHDARGTRQVGRRPRSAPPGGGASNSSRTNPSSAAPPAGAQQSSSGTSPDSELWQRGRAAVLAWVQQVRRAARTTPTDGAGCSPGAAETTASSFGAASPAVLPRKHRDLPPPAAAPRAAVKGTCVRMDSDAPRFPAPRSVTGEPIGDAAMMAALAIDGERGLSDHHDDEDDASRADGSLRVFAATARRVLRRSAASFHAATEAKSAGDSGGDDGSEAARLDRHFGSSHRLDSTDRKSAATGISDVESVGRGRSSQTRSLRRSSHSVSHHGGSDRKSASPNRPHVPVLVGYARMTGRDDAFDPFGRKPMRLPPSVSAQGGDGGAGAGSTSAGSVASLSQSSGRRRRDRRRRAAREAARLKRRAAAADAKAQARLLAASFGGKSADTSIVQGSSSGVDASQDGRHGDETLPHDHDHEDSDSGSDVWLEEAVDSAAAAQDDGSASQLHLRPDDRFSARRRRAPAHSFARSERFPDAPTTGASGAGSSDGELAVMAAALGVALEPPQATPGTGAAPSAELLLRPERADLLTRRSVRGQRYDTFGRRSGRDGAVVGGSGPSAAGAEAVLAPGLARHFASEFGVDEATALQLLRSTPIGGRVSGGPESLPDLSVLDAAAAASTFGGHGARGLARGLHVDMARAPGRPGNDEPTAAQLLKYMARQAERHAAAEGAEREVAARGRHRKRAARSEASGKESDGDSAAGGHGEAIDSLSRSGAAVAGLSDYDTLEFLADRQAATAGASEPGAGRAAAPQTLLRRTSRPPLVRPRHIRLSGPRPGDEAADDDATAGFAALQLTVDGYAAIRAAGMTLDEFRQVLFGPPDPAVAADIAAALAEAPSSIAGGGGDGLLGLGLELSSMMVGDRNCASALPTATRAASVSGSRGGVQSQRRPGPASRSRSRSRASNRSSRVDASGSVFGSALADMAAHPGREAPLADPEQGAAATGASLDDAAAVLAAFTALNI